MLTAAILTGEMLKRPQPEHNLETAVEEILSHISAMRVFSSFVLFFARPR